MAPLSPPPGADSDRETLSFGGNSLPTIDEALSRYGASLPQTRLIQGTEPCAPVDPDQPYAVGREVARGGMGAILEAEDTRLLRRVAMKVMLRPGQVGPEQVRRFIREAQIAGQLEHPSIVPVHELNVDAAGKPYYTMKFVCGRTLRDILSDLARHDDATVAEFTLARLLAVVRRACEAVAFAHSRGVVHRDLKPENIMVGSFGEVQVMDWGLAKALSDGDGGNVDVAPVAAASVRLDGEAAAVETMEGHILGTPSFMAPEQAGGKHGEISPATDVYALGAVLYQVLTLEPPVIGSSVNEILIRVHTGDIEPPLRRIPRPSLPHCPGGRPPAALSAVCMRAMSRKPAERYPSALTLRDELQAYTEGYATAAEDAGLFRQLHLLVGRHRLAFSVAAAALTLIVVITAIAFVRISASEQRASDELARFELSEAQRLEQGRLAAPEFARAAAQQLQLQQWSVAATTARIAVDMAPDLPEAWLQCGRSRLAAMDLAGARAAWNRAQEAAAEGSVAQHAIDYLDLTARLSDSSDRTPGQWRRPEVFRVAQALQEHGDLVLAGRLMEQIGADDEALRLRLKAARAALAAVNGTPIPEPTIQSGSVGMTLAKLPVTDLTPLTGLPLNDLDLRGTWVSNLSCLKGMPLRRLDISETAVGDLSALRNMPLERLELRNTLVSDLRPVRELPLTWLDCRGSPITDLRPLANMPLISLWLSDCDVEDLTPLRGKQLQLLEASYTKVHDLGALHGLPLQRLIIDRSLGDGVRDLSPLRGMELEVLSLAAAPISDLSSLVAMPLRILKLNRTKVSDLQPLTGISLQELDLSHTPVRDLGPVAQPDLRVLHLYGCAALEDLSPLRNCPRLRELTVPEHLATSVLLRDLPALERLGISETMPVTEFWRRH